LATVASASCPLRESSVKQHLTKQNELANLAGSQATSPVRVKLRQVTAVQATAYPPQEARGVWWERLKTALGTCSSAFVQASLSQLIAACRLPLGGISEVAVNAALAFIEGQRPQNELEAALVIQMACTHSATMNIFSRIHGDYCGERTLNIGANALARLMRTYAIQVETLRRLRNGVVQVVRVEHVHVEKGAQAVIGAVVQAP
jgi:hypothetical protein